MPEPHAHAARREALRFLVPLALLDLVLAFLALAWPPVWVLFGLGFLLTLFVAYFFRDPRRVPPPDEAILVSAADGLVVGIDEMDEPDFGLGRMRRIAVFLSVFDVHLNRVPADGTVAKTVYREGKFLDVRHPDASTRNECLAWRLETPRGPLAVRQIAGLIARRIVPWAREGEAVRRGGRFGMIRFGSRTEVFVPLGCAILVKPGDRVAGGRTPIARWP